MSGSKSDDLKGPPLGAYLEDAKEGETRKGPCMGEGAAGREPAPAFVAADECSVRNQK